MNKQLDSRRIRIEINEEQMGLSDTTNALYDYGDEQNKIEVDDCIT